MGEGPAERLLVADEIRADDVDGAIAIYREHAVSIALSHPVGRDRLRWIIAEGFAYDPRFDDLVREAAAGDGDEDLRRRAGLVLAQHAARDGDHAGAHAILLEGFRAEGGHGTPLELATALNLALVCNLLHRDFEALVFARHGAVLAEAQGDARGRLQAVLHVATTHLDLAEEAGIELDLCPLFDLAERAAAKLPPAQAGMSLARLALLRTRDRLRRGDLEGARMSHEEWGAMLREHQPPGVEAELGRLIETLTTLESKGAQAALARALAACEAGQDGLPDDAPLRVELVRLLFTCGREDEGRETADRVIRACRGDAGGAGSARGLRVAAALGHLLEERGEAPLAREAYVVASDSAAARISELNRELEELGDLAAIREEDRDLLAGYRHAFVERHRGLARILRERMGPGHEAYESLRGSGGWIRTCAWCRSVLVDEGRVVPVGHLLPSDSTFEITHGMCDGCAERQLRPLRGGRATR